MGTAEGRHKREEIVAIPVFMELELVTCRDNVYFDSVY